MGGNIPIAHLVIRELLLLKIETVKGFPLLTDVCLHDIGLERGSL
jgi:hypothetical protein